MASNNPAYAAILNNLNRDVSREQPTDIIQFCADWFQDKLREERSGPSKGGSSTPRNVTGVGPFDSAPGEQHPGSLSPHERGPTDGPFKNSRGTGAAGAAAAGAAAGAAAVGGASLFSKSPFGGSGSPAQAEEGSPLSEDGPGGQGRDSPFGPGHASPFGASPFGASAQTPSAPVGRGNVEPESPPDEPTIPHYALGRRTSVSAESLVPAHSRPFDPSNQAFIEEEDEDEAAPSNALPAFPKTPEQLKRIRAAISPNFLFRNLDPEQEADVLAAMKEVTVAANETVIEQGAAGDYFYVVESGEFDIFVKRDGESGIGQKVATSREGQSFGELALMHNAPRAATIVSTQPSVLWALDRVSFRTILLDHTSRKRRLYETFLSTVPILSSLKPAERAKIADVLESRTFNVGEDVIRQDEAGEEFFLIESGTANAIKNVDGKDTVVKTMSKGDYFGELALLNRQTRAATVRAAEKLVVVALGEQAFTRLLGPVKDIMARSAGERYS